MTKNQEAIILCARQLSAKLKEIQKHPSYEAVWFSAAKHGLSYDGPNYELELKALDEALKNSK